jgi:hypothetical protein
LLLVRRGKSPVDAQARALLVATYQGEAERVAEIVGRSPPWSRDLLGDSR